MTSTTARTLRLPPDIAEAVKMHADYEDLSQNEWLILAARFVVAERRADLDYMIGLRRHFAGKLEQLDKP